MIDTSVRIRDYESRGLKVEHGFDRPGTVYPAHAHERTILYTSAGSLTLKLNNGEQTIELIPGEEFVIESGQQHEGKVGDFGWGYVVAFDPSEAEQFEH